MGKMKVESGKWVFTTKVKAAGEVRSRQGRKRQKLSR